MSVWVPTARASGLSDAYSPILLTMQDSWSALVDSSVSSTHAAPSCCCCARASWTTYKQDDAVCVKPCRNWLGHLLIKLLSVNYIIPKTTIYWLGVRLFTGRHPSLWRGEVHGCSIIFLIKKWSMLAYIAACSLSAPGSFRDLAKSGCSVAHSNWCWSYYVNFLQSYP